METKRFLPSSVIEIGDDLYTKVLNSRVRLEK